MGYIVLEDHHSGKTQCWYAASKARIIELGMHEDCFYYSESYDYEEALDMHNGRDEDIPPGHKKMLATGRKLKAYHHGHDLCVEFSDGPTTEFDAAQYAIFHDFASGEVMTLEEAEQRVSNKDAGWEAIEKCIERWAF